MLNTPIWNQRLILIIMFELIVAFGAGLISFLSPCVLPLIPGYISYITGNSLSELIEKKRVN